MLNSFRRWRLKRRIAKDLKGVNWAVCRKNSDYVRSGEFQALQWLKAYSENLAAAEPYELLEAILTHGGGLDSHDKDMAATILRYMYVRF